MDDLNASFPLSFSYTFPTNVSIHNTTFYDLSCSGHEYILWMDPRIWSKLPQRLLERIIAFLPLPDIFRMRCVCKRWYTVMFSHSFLQLHFQVSPRRQWFMFFKQSSQNSRNTNCSISATSCEGYMFNPHEFTWHRLTFPLIPSRFTPVASSGGLVCFISEEAGTKSIVLYNPLVNTASQLPTSLRPRLFPSIGLNISPSSMEIALAGDDLISPYAVKNLSNESFRIDAGGFYSPWDITSPLPRLCSLESGEMVFVNHKFYCMNYGPFSVLCYDIATNTWNKIQAPMRRFLRSPSLVESQGKLVLVAAVEKSKLNVPKSFRLWKLETCGTSWIEMERMPHHHYMQFSEVEVGDGFHCVGHGDFIIISSKRGIPGFDHKRALIFNTIRKSWQWLPSCPYVRPDCEYLHGFAYEPSLSTPITALLEQLHLM